MPSPGAEGKDPLRPAHVTSALRYRAGKSAVVIRSYGADESAVLYSAACTVRCGRTHTAAELGFSAVQEVQVKVTSECSFFERFYFSDMNGYFVFVLIVGSY